MIINELNSIKNKHLFLEKDENGREIYIYNLEKCKFTGDNLFYPNVLIYYNDNLYSPMKEKIMSLESLENNTEYEYNETINKKVENTPVFYFVYNTDNYYHFVYDTLPYLISYNELKKQIPDLKLLMNYPNPKKDIFYTFVVEFLQLLDISIEDIIIVDKDAEYSKVYISTSYTHDIDSNLPPRNEIYDFYKHIISNVNIIKDTPKKIYISRRSWVHGDYSNIGTNYTMRRKLENEDDLVEMLCNNGFVEVFSENLSTIEKISYFNNADIVIGAIGGGICNVLFSPKDAKLIALISPTFLSVNKRFIYSLEKVNIEYFVDTEHSEKDYFKTNMRVKTNNGIVGEIEKVYENSVLISYTKDKVSGWNSEMIFDKIEIDKNFLTKLDDGLNSPWKVKIKNIKYKI